MPNSTAATRLPIRAPAPTLSPVSNAKAAPVKDSSLEPCTAKDICRITTNGPISPATSASSAPATNACWTNPRLRRSAVTSKAKRLCSSSSRASLMAEPLVSHHHVLPPHSDHVDGRAVERRQILRRHHLVDRTDAEPSVDQVEHPVDER